MSEVIREAVIRARVDLAKRVIQAHAVHGRGRVVTNRTRWHEQFMPWCAPLPPGCIA